MAAATLPPLRNDLTMLPGAPAHDGAPTWTLHDPLRNQFFRLTWAAVEILKRWNLGSPDTIAERVTAETSLTISPADVVGMVDFLSRSQLLKPRDAADVARLVAARDGAQVSWWQWLLHHYLFFRVPLARPDGFLEAALPAVRWMGGRAFRLATLAALLLGLWLIGRQWEGFAATLVDHFSASGLLAFALALAVAKICHELAHGFTAKHYGCRVPAMGVAFLVLWPMLYTDVNETWKLTDRRQRLTVAAAGLAAELTIAAWASLAWGLLPDGALRSMAFTLAAVTWITSLALNTSPFMRFDGYFLAMDALDQPNLHPRSFALARWRLREFLFGLGEAVPEEGLPVVTRRWMIAFAWAVWIYRLVLFLGIAMLVYHFFIKVVGILLFAVEVGWFVVRPILAELVQWRVRVPHMRPWRAAVSLLLLAALATLLLAPWNNRVAAPALLRAERHQRVFAPAPARLVALEVSEGQAVRAEQVLARLESPDAVFRLAQLDARLSVLKYELSSVAFDEDFRLRSRSMAEELDAVLTERAAVEAELRRLTLTAPADGVVADLSPLLAPGQWVSPKEELMAVRSGAEIDAYVAEADLPRLAAGAAARFIGEGLVGAVPARLVAIDRAAVANLPDASLGSPYGGPIAARSVERALIPDASLYRVRLAPVQPSDITAPLRGQVQIEGEAYSLLGPLLRSVAATLIREGGM